MAYGKKRQKPCELSVDAKVILENGDHPPTTGGNSDEIRDADKWKTVICYQRRRKEGLMFSSKNGEVDLVIEKVQECDGDNPRRKSRRVPKKSYSEVDGDDFSSKPGGKPTKKGKDELLNNSKDEDHVLPAKNDQGVAEGSLMCHQCQRNDTGRVVRCKKCQRKRFCEPCLSTWYPKLTKNEVESACPVCQENCNCKSCLRLDGPLKEKFKKLKFTRKQQVQHWKYSLQALLPYVKQFSEEQMMEKTIEAKVQGLSPSDTHPEQTFCSPKERVYCDSCRTSIVDFHRSCPKCGYDLCLTCCWELRGGCLEVGEKEVNIQYVDRGDAYLHGEPLSSTPSEEEKCGEVPFKQNDDQNHKRATLQWKPNEDGSISCPPKDLSGCGGGLLVLKCMFKENAIVELVKKSEGLAKSLHLESLSQSPNQKCSCFNSEGEIDVGNDKL